MASIDSNWVLINQRPPEPLSTRAINYSKSGVGLLRLTQVGKATTGIAKEISFSPLTQKLHSGFSSTLPILNFWGLPSTTQDAYKAVQAYASGGPMIGAIKETTGAVTSWGNALHYLFGGALLRKVISVTDLSSDVADCIESNTNYRKAALFEKKAPTDSLIKKAYEHAKRYHMIRIAKAVIAIVSSFLAFVFLALGIELLPAIALFAISLTGALFAIRRDLYKDEGPTPLISLSI